jgi:hypothetical protein
MADTLLIVSKSAFAALRGVGVSAVSKWIKRGRISGAALTADRRINVAEAERQLAATGDVARSVAAIVAARANADDAQSRDLLRAKVLAAQIDVERKRRQLAVETGRYMLTADARADWVREIAQFIATVEQRLPDLVAQLGGGQEEILMARRWWRSLRASESAAAAERAQGLPEFIEDSGE